MPIFEGVSLRAEVPGDEPFLAELHYSVREGEFVSLGWPPEMLRTFLAGQFRIQAAQYASRYPGMERWIVEMGGTAVGRLYVARSAGETRVVEISLLPEWRGRGLGGHLLGELVREAVTGGMALRLSVVRENPAIRLYRRLGFVEVGGDGVYAEMSFTVST